jgi:hypothetical protein
MKFYMYYVHKLTKLKQLVYTTSISVEKYANIIQPCFQLLVQEYCSLEIYKWSKENHVQKLVREINSVQR